MQNDEIINQYQEYELLGLKPIVLPEQERIKMQNFLLIFQIRVEFQTTNGVRI